MKEELIRQAAERYFAYLTRNPARLLDQFAPNGHLEDADGTPYRGRDAIAAYIETWLAAYQTLHFAIERIMVFSDQAAVRWTARGVTCAGNSAQFNGIVMLRFDEQHRIVSARHYHTDTRVLAQTA